MNRKEPPDPPETLRIALKQLEHLAGSASAEPAIAQLRRTLLKRLADCEGELAILQHLTPGLEDVRDTCCPACQPPLTMAELQLLEDAVENDPGRTAN